MSQIPFDFWLIISSCYYVYMLDLMNYFRIRVAKQENSLNYEIKSNTWTGATNNFTRKMYISC